MKQPVSILIPDWFEDIDPDLRADQLLRNRYFMRMAALMASPEGTVASLAALVGVSPVAVQYPYLDRPKRGVISPSLALRLQQVIGEDRMPARLLRPDLF